MYDIVNDLNVLKVKEEGKIYLPYEDWKLEDKEKIEAYYKHAITWQEASEYLYGGKALTEIVTEIDIDIEDVVNRIVKFSLKTSQGWVRIKNLSFKQLLVESSYRYGRTASRSINDWEEDSWNKLSIQQRVEVCQNELSRWSVVVIDKTHANWNAGVPSELSITGGEWIDYLEIVNNCTTSRGFELKIKTDGSFYHGSFIMPQEPYRKLCTVQSGAWAAQGWNVLSGPPENFGNYYASLINPQEKPQELNNPTFGQIYATQNNAHPKILIDLTEYRDLVQDTEKSYPVIINRGDIVYDRWGKGKEYETKPHKRKLVIHSCNNSFVTPPKTYAEILNPLGATGDFRLPKFGEDGLYDVRVAEEMNKYSLLNKLETLTITKTSAGLYELELGVKSLPTDNGLCKIVLGNIKLDLGNDFFVIDRFCFNPRSTVSHYNHRWLPAAETFGAEKKAPYAFILGRELTIEGVNGNIFIQPEKWGIERAILKREGDILFIDLISYERIVPVWQGKINLGAENV